MANRASKVMPLKNVNELSEHHLANLAISVTSKNNQIESVEFPWRCYSTDITLWKESNSLLSVVSSFIPEMTNKISFLHASSGQVFFECEQRYPITKVQFCPSTIRKSQWLASSGLDLHLWKLEGDSVTQHVTLSNKKNLVSPPLTSFDWCSTDPTQIGTCSIDTTCTFWDVEKQQIKMQLIAHDREVFDFSFAPKDPHRFVSVGADGSMRLFDLRTLEHSTILWEEPSGAALMRTYWNPLDDNFVATFAQDSPNICIVDIRQVGKCVATLKGPFAHATDLSSLAWSPLAPNVLASADEDGLVMIWDLTESVDKPVFFKQLSNSVSSLKWSPYCPNEILVSNGNRVDSIRVL